MAEVTTTATFVELATTTELEDELELATEEATASGAAADESSARVHPVFAVKAAGQLTSIHKISTVQNRISRPDVPYLPEPHSLPITNEERESKHTLKLNRRVIRALKPVKAEITSILQRSRVRITQ